MSTNHKPLPDEVEHLLRNAQLRDELEPYFDESIRSVNVEGRRIVLEFTDHLNDRELYCLIYRDILPCSEKKIDSATNYLHWDCADVGGDPTTWLRYYATPEERRAWAEDLDEPLPEREVAPYPRQLPRRPL